MKDHDGQSQQESRAPQAPSESMEAPAGGPAPEMGEVVDEFIPSPAELAVVDPSDQHEVMLRMDDHDVRMLLEHVQTSALRKWVYEFPQDGKPVRGLTVHAVQDIVQRMNWTGKAKIGLLTDADGRPVLDVERVVEEGEPYWMVTAYARDEVTDSVLPGASYEPVYMKLRKKNPDGSAMTKFDPFSRWKAIQKASRNALAAHIPEEIKQTILAMFSNDPARVERIRTEAEQKVLDRPPPLVDEQAKAKLALAREMYDQIRELGGSAVTEFTPGKFGAYVLNAQHSHETLDAFVDYVRGELDRLTEKYRTESAA